MAAKNSSICVDNLWFVSVWVLKNVVTTYKSLVRVIAADRHLLVGNIERTETNDSVVRIVVELELMCCIDFTWLWVHSLCIVLTPADSQFYIVHATPNCDQFNWTVFDHQCVINVQLIVDPNANWSRLKMAGREKEREGGCGWWWGWMCAPTWYWRRDTLRSLATEKSRATGGGGGDQRWWISY